MMIRLEREALGATGLREDQLEFFAVHGWVMASQVFSETDCRVYTELITRCLKSLEPWQVNDGLQGVAEPHLQHPAFLDWFRRPGILPATRQLVGHNRPRLRHSIALRTDPHPERHRRKQDLSAPKAWKWHRDFQPESVLRCRGDSPGIISSQAIATVTYFSSAARMNGATALLDRSHLYRGGYATLSGKLSCVEPEVQAGGILFFTEALLHSATPIITENTRFALLNWFTVPWFGGSAVKPFGVDRWNDQELRSVFRDPYFGDQVLD